MQPISKDSPRTYPTSVKTGISMYQLRHSYRSHLLTWCYRIGEAFPIVDIVPLLWDDGDVITTGLLNNLIYDVPNFATNSVVTVNGTAFAVECHSISGASQSGDFDPATGTFPIHISDQINDVHISPCELPSLCSHTFN